MIKTQQIVKCICWENKTFLNHFTGDRYTGTVLLRPIYLGANSEVVKWLSELKWETGEILWKWFRMALKPTMVLKEASEKCYFFRTTASSFKTCANKVF